MGGGGVMMGDNYLPGVGDYGHAPASQPLVSVVIPTRNRSPLLLSAIWSVLYQTYANVEIIVVDDGSTDDTPALLAGMTDSRVRYIRHSPPRGASVARNIGIRAARGEVIGFLDDDDEWLPMKVERQLAALKGYDAVLCSSDAAQSRHGKGSSDVITVLPDDFRRSPFAVGGTGVLMVRAPVIKDVLFDEALPRCQDWDIFIRIASKYRVGYLNEPLLRYNHGSHDRISNELINLTPVELEKRLCMLNKHKVFFGKYWYKNHLCGMLLYGIRYRRRRMRHLAYVARRCGLMVTVVALMQRLWQVGKKHLPSHTFKTTKRTA